MCSYTALLLHCYITVTEGAKINHAVKFKNGQKNGNQRVTAIMTF
jgi:hypothetical protein